MRALALGLLFGLAFAETCEKDNCNKQVSDSIYVEPSGLVHGVPGDSYATACPDYCVDFPDRPEKQCGVVRRKCVLTGDGGMKFEGAANSGSDEPCKPIRWGNWSPHSNWVCREGTETRCQMRACGCHEADTCYDYFSSEANRRRPNDFTELRCNPQASTSSICHDFDSLKGAITKGRQTKCETRPFVCHCAAEKNTMCPHCASWPRTAAGASASAKCGCGYKGSMSRQCVMSPDQCSCQWAAPQAQCRKIAWEGWGGWDRECPVQCAPQGGRVPEKIYRERFQNCNEDLSECEAVAKLGCIGPRGHEQELCKNFKQCECTEPTTLFKDPIAAGGVAPTRSVGGDPTPEPKKIAAEEAPKAKRPSRRGRRKLENIRKGKGASIFSNLQEGVKNIFKGRKRRRTRKKRGSQ